MKSWIICAVLAVVPLSVGASPRPLQGSPTRVVVLGVDHAAQLISPNDSPSTLAAFLDMAAPDAICIERSPEAFARNSFYEFTYEVQDVVVPFARARGIALCPVDWEPAAEDAKLGFGMDLESVPEVRPYKGFQGFLAFPQPGQLKRDIFHADTVSNLTRISEWSHTPAKKAVDDLPRRMYLYRTYLQAKRLAAAANAHPGGTVLLVVGEFHKRDIESILADEEGIEVVQPSAIGRSVHGKAASFNNSLYRFAVASFNLLGVQSATGNIDYAFVGEAVSALLLDESGPEAELFSIRLQLLRNCIDSEEAVRRYRRIAAEAGDRRFSWTGVLDESRVDSYFDPFGNLSVRQRAMVEIARELAVAGAKDEVEDVFSAIASELTQLKSRQLDAYFSRYIRSESERARDGSRSVENSTPLRCN